MGKLFIHIGLPKTATTSLQVDFFTKLKKYNINYLGVKQPRGRENNKLFNQFMKSLNSSKDIAKTKSMLENKLKDEDLLISEEMIVVSNGSFSWKNKIKNLYNIIESFDYTIIVSVREPVSAMFSYYVELFSKYKKLNKSFEKIILSEESMEIYHFRKFFNYLTAFFVNESIKVIQFEDVIKKDYKNLKEVFKINVDESFQIGQHNVKKIKSDRIFKKQKYSFGTVLFKIVETIGLYNYLRKSRLNFMLKELFLILNKLSINRNIKIKRPSEQEFSTLRREIKKETTYLMDNYNIDYISNIKG